jgi:hypothetical protein
MTQTRKIGKTATKVLESNRYLIVKYHNTNVVVFDKVTREINLNTDGWKTATTKLRMNQTSNEHGLGFHVRQEKGLWYVTNRNREIPETIPFNNDSLTIKL